MKTIELREIATLNDLLLLTTKANEDCYCTRQMQSDLSVDTNPTTCLPCACRFALNAISSVAEEVRKGV